MPTLAVSEYAAWAGTFSVMAIFGLLAYRATRTRPEDREADEASRAEDAAAAVHRSPEPSSAGEPGSPEDASPS